MTKKDETKPTPKADKASLEIAEYLGKMKAQGARLCEKCNGHGYTRDEETREHTKCETCKGTGSTLRAEGELQAFPLPKHGPDGDPIQAGWEYRANLHKYELIIPGAERVLVAISDKEIDARLKKAKPTDNVAELVAMIQELGTAAGVL